MKDLFANQQDNCQNVPYRAQVSSLQSSDLSYRGHRTLEYRTLSNKVNHRHLSCGILLLLALPDGGSLPLGPPILPLFRLLTMENSQTDEDSIVDLDMAKSVCQRTWEGTYFFLPCRCWHCLGQKHLSYTQMYLLTATDDKEHCFPAISSKFLEIRTESVLVLPKG